MPLKLKSPLCPPVLSAMLLTIPMPLYAQQAPEGEKPDQPETQSENQDAQPGQPITIYGRASEMVGLAFSASEGIVGNADLENRPLHRTGELVEVIPGMVATQHSGSGKANQYFLRGFNLDHGTDFSAQVDHMPVNLRTHGHGQGWLDLNFLIPELVQQIAWRKGPYFADSGDFSSAGSARFTTYDRLDRNIAELSIGESGYVRGLLAASVATGSGNILVAAETAFNDTPFDLDENLEKFNGLIKYSQDGGSTDWEVSLSGYDARWDSSDQIPLRAVQSGQISRLGFIDPDAGGHVTRIALNANAESENFTAALWGLYSNMHLWSNFTYFATDPVNGDEFLQRDERISFGGSLKRVFPLQLAGGDARINLGADLRYDDIFNIGLFNTRARQIIGTIRDDDVSEFSLGSYAELEWDLADNLRLRGGLRLDFYSHDVDARLAQNSGDGSDAIVTPTLALAWQPAHGLEIYANYGEGFHSNDVRGASTTVDPLTLDPVDPVDVLVRSRGAEIGARHEADGFNIAINAFWLELGSELVFVGDAGTTEPNGATRRFGIEASSFWQPTPWLVLDASAAWTDARFTNAPGEHRIPQAVEKVASAGIRLIPLKGLNTALRLRHFSKAPLIEDGSVFSEATTVVNFGIYYQLGPARLGFDIFNLFDTKDADITYFYESRLPGEAAAVEDIHFKPVEPLQVRGSLRLSF